MRTVSLCMFFFFGVFIHAKTIIVDINGSGSYNSIAIAANVAQDGDTVKVLPGVYTEAISITKNIVLMGSGYEMTSINSSNDPAITMSNGKLMWFSVTSTGGSGISFTGGIVANCVFQGSSYNGITIQSGATGSIINCVVAGNGNCGLEYNSYSRTIAGVQNTISFQNGKYGFNGSTELYVNYSNGSYVSIKGEVGLLTTDPAFNSATDYRLKLTSPCIDSGNPALYDPDGSRSDMGYFGGPDCPIYPVVTQLKIVPLDNGNLQIHASGRANY